MRLDKRGAATNAGAEIINTYLHGVPFVSAIGTTKGENSKERALYPTDIVDYFL